jgi:riboflavin biosynthesis pyrimidine reductase
VNRGDRPLPRDGGPDFAASPTRLDLVDEYELSMIPVAIGARRGPFAPRRPEGRPGRRQRARVLKRSARAEPAAVSNR